MTTDELKEYIDAILEERDKRIDQAMKSSHLAIEKAEAAQERRLFLLNEFREQAADESKKYTTKETTEGLTKMVNLLSTQVSRLYGGLAVVALVGVANMVKVFFAAYHQ